MSFTAEWGTPVRGIAVERKEWRRVSLVVSLKPPFLARVRAVRFANWRRGAEWFQRRNGRRRGVVQGILTVITTSSLFFCLNFSRLCLTEEVVNARLLRSCIVGVIVEAAVASLGILAVVFQDTKA